MSRAFVKEDDQQPDTVVPRPQRDHPNYVTPEGFRGWQQRAVEMLGQLQAGAELAEGDLTLAAERETLKRDLRSLEETIETAIVVTPPSGPTDEVRFGAWVTLEDESGQAHRIRLVGADEVCIQRGEVSWTSPLGKALIGRRAGDTTLWERPGGNLEVEITHVSYRP
jgi:transcription elongation factor GreB